MLALFFTPDVVSVIVVIVSFFIVVLAVTMTGVTWVERLILTAIVVLAAGDDVVAVEKDAGSRCSLSCLRISLIQS
jgi:hypothetical protein